MKADSWPEEAPHLGKLANLSAHWLLTETYRCMKYPSPEEMGTGKNNAAVRLFTAETCQPNSTGSFWINNLKAEKNAANISPVCMHCCCSRFQLHHHMNKNSRSYRKYLNQRISPTETWVWPTEHSKNYVILEGKVLARNQLKYCLICNTQGMRKIKACISMWVADELNHLCWRPNALFFFLLLHL